MDRNLVILLVVIVVLALAMAAVCVFIFWRSRKGAGTGKGRNDAGANHPLALFRDSLSRLRAKSPGSRYQYRVPWVLALGESGAGKSALLDELAADDQGDAPEEPGVRWRFLSRGALIEVPGSFLVSPEGRAVPSGPWIKFLRLLVRHRSERPIDGIILFIPAPELLPVGQREISVVEDKTKAAALRAKLDQLQQILGIAAPVYVVVTKCDQVRGFRAFCENIGPEFEDDMFGWSNPDTLDTAFRSEWIDGAFDSIEQGLLRHQLMTFGRKSVTAADDLFIFPLEFDRLRVPLRTRLTECFRESSYLDPHFLRGIYFCGDSTANLSRVAIPEPLGGPAVVNGNAGAPRQLVPISALRGVDRYRPRIAFARHLLEYKIFLETGIARPLSRVWFSRNRAVIVLQVALTLFLIVFGLGTWRGYDRLLNLREQRFNGVLQELVNRVGENGRTSRAYPVATAYDFVDDLGVLDAQGFQSFFLPASWRDPINSQISTAIGESFSDTVLPSFRTALEARAASLIGACGPVPPIEVVSPDEVDTQELRLPKNDPEYIALEKSLKDYGRLRDAIRGYDNIRSPGVGSFADLNTVFAYLAGRTLQDESRFRNNPYYQRALRQSTGDPVASAASGRLDECVAEAALSRSHNFFDSWFEKTNPLIELTESVKQQIDDLQTTRAASRDKVDALINDIRGLDTMVSGGAYAWLSQSAYNRGNYPALSATLSSQPFADKAFLDKVDEDGSQHFAQTKSGLLSTAQNSTGFILNVTAAGVRVSGPVIALGNGLAALIGQDFMSIQDSPAVLNTQVQPLLWNKAALARASQMEDSYDKYLREWLPLFPSGLRDAVHSVAAGNLQTAVLGAVARAQEPLEAGVASDPSSLLLEIQSFQTAAATVLQLQGDLPPATRGSHGDLELLLNRQSTYLAERLAGIFQATSLYQPVQANLRKWDGTETLTETGYGVRNDDELENYFVAQREQVKKVALDYAQPLAQYMSSHHIEQPRGFAVWPGIVRDVQDYEGKKPGNPISALESFIHVSLNKIDPKAGCAVDPGARTGSDYFLTLRISLQTEVTERCGELVEDNYSRQIEAFFNQHLAGNFPFGPLPAAEGPEAGSKDTIEFFSRVDAYAPGILLWLLHAHDGSAAVLTFLKQAVAARQMFTGGLKDGALFADVQLVFRANRAAEVLGDRIIDWECHAGDQVARKGGSDSFRWSYGNALQLTLRFAKDSPEIPLSGTDAPDARIDGRTVTYSFTDPWALYTLLRQHYGGDVDYGSAAGRSLGLMRFAIPVGPDTSRQKLSPPSIVKSTARVFVRVILHEAGAAGAAAPKAPVEVPLAVFPESAPSLSTPAPKTLSE